MTTLTRQPPHLEVPSEPSSWKINFRGRVPDKAQSLIARLRTLSGKTLVPHKVERNINNTEDISVYPVYPVYPRKYHELYLSARQEACSFNDQRKKNRRGCHGSRVCLARTLTLDNSYCLVYTITICSRVCFLLFTFA